MRRIRSILAVSRRRRRRARASAGRAASARTERDAVRCRHEEHRQTAVAAGQFKTLASLLKQAGLVKTL